MFEDLFVYDLNAPIEIHEISTRTQEGAVVRDLSYVSPFNRRREAYLIRPEAPSQEPLAAVLFVHWYEPKSADSDRTQFLEEAVQLASQGVVSLLVETMWSDRDWFLERTQEDDWQNSVEQVVELRQAMDILLAEPGVDPTRFAYVGHDFGAMYGILMGALDPRPMAYALMAGTPRFPDWYLYYPRLEGEARQVFIESFEAMDPISNVSRLAPAALLFQFGQDDLHVPVEKAEEFYRAALHPKEIHWYNAGHGLNQQACDDRLAWLALQLGL